MTCELRVEGRASAPAWLVVSLRPTNPEGVTGAGLTFRSDVGDLAHIWWNSTTFGHCLFIGPVIGWLVWQRRRELAALTPTAWWPGLLLVAAGGAGWLMGDAGSVSFARQLGVVLMLQGAVVTLLGAQVAGSSVR